MGTNTWSPLFKKCGRNLNMQYFALTILALMILSCLIYLISVWSSGKISGVYYDKILDNKGLTKLIIFAPGFSERCMRASIYLLFILINGNPFVTHHYKWYPKNLVKRYYDTFGNINFRAHARKQDWILAIIMWGSALVFILTLILICIFSNL